jgi:hypothetical protein
LNFIVGGIGLNASLAQGGFDIVKGGKDLGLFSVNRYGVLEVG